MVKSNKSLIIILSCLVIAACIFITWKGISNNDVFIESKDGKWKVGYVKAEETESLHHMFPPYTIAFRIIMLS